MLYVSYSSLREAQKINVSLMLMLCIQKHHRLLAQFDMSKCHFYSATAILFVCPSICPSDSCIVTKMMDCGYFDTTRYGNQSSFLTPNSV